MVTLAESSRQFSYGFPPAVQARSLVARFGRDDCRSDKKTESDKSKRDEWSSRTKRNSLLTLMRKLRLLQAVIPNSMKKRTESQIKAPNFWVTPRAGRIFGEWGSSATAPLFFSVGSSQARSVER